MIDYQQKKSTFFFFNDTATTEIYTLSLHDALPISSGPSTAYLPKRALCYGTMTGPGTCVDRKSTRLNSSHSQISYAVFCLKKKNIARRASAPSPPTPNDHPSAHTELLAHQQIEPTA